jgi:hypothetical protein
MAHLPITLPELLGLAAGACLLTAAAMRQMRALRSVALLGSLLLTGYGFAAGVLPAMVMGGLLMPAHAWRLWQCLRAGRRPPAGYARPGYRSRPLPIPLGTEAPSPPQARPSAAKPAPHHAPIRFVDGTRGFAPLFPAEAANAP